MVRVLSARLVGSAALVALALAGCGSSSSGSPEATINSFLQASAAGDGAKACAQLTAAAQQQVVTGASCEQGIKLAGAAYRPIIKQIKVANLQVQGSAATGTSTLNGRAIAVFQLTKSGGKWMISGEHSAAASQTSPAATAPSQTRVAAVARCVGKAFGVENAGVDSTGGAPHVVLSLDVSGRSAAMIDVFTSPAAASAAYAAIKAGAGSQPATLNGSLVIVRLGALTAAQQQQLQACS